MPDFAFENVLRARGVWPVAGCDEAGRGPLAGPVAAAAVILAPDDLPPGIDDSKKLTAGARDELYHVIFAKAVAIGVSFASHAEIDTLNIRAASFLAMRRAIAALAVAPAHILIDGNALPGNLSCNAEAIVKGDTLSLSIAAASIVAKVTRDRLMRNLDIACPSYGFGDHVGYATLAHRRAIEKLGASPYHRRSFAPITAALAKPRTAAARQG